MPDSLVFGKTFNLLGKSVNIAAKRHSLIAGNIANMNTIGYQPKDIDFHQALERELNNQQDDLARTHKKHMSGDTDSELSGKVRKSEGDEFNLDSVNIDTEMTNLAENNIKYRTSVELLMRKIAKMRHVIQEGGR